MNHVMVRGVAGRTLYEDDNDRHVFLSQAARQFDGVLSFCLVWALMLNHGHLLPRTGELSLSSAMHRLNTGYATYFNKRHSRQGHLFQNRFKSLLIDGEPYLFRAIRYVLLNPVRAGVVDGLETLERYPWTSYPDLLGNRAAKLGEPELVLRLFADDVQAARRELRSWLVAGLKEDDPIARVIERGPGRPSREQRIEEIAARIHTRDASVLGNREFVASVLEQTRANAAAGLRREINGWTLDVLVREASARFEVESNLVTEGGRARPASDARAAAAWLATTYLGLTQTDLAEQFSVSQPALSRSRARGKKLAERHLPDLLLAIQQAGGRRKL